MDLAYMGQVFMFGYNWPPKSYMLCYGQLLGINQNQALFSILGTTYGGNGSTTFALPDLRGRTVMGQGQGGGLSNYPLGAKIGTENITLLSTNLPAHNHMFGVSNAAATVGDPTGAFLSQGSIIDNKTVPVFSSTAPNGTVMNPGELANAGSSAPLSVLQPYLGINFSICTNGLFPSRN